MPKKNTSRASSAETLLVELLTEELPPKALRMLGQAFADRVLNFLVQFQLKTRDPRGIRVFSTPRRLAVLIPDVLGKARDREIEVTGPSISVGLDAEGKPTPALAGFAKKNGVNIADLVQRDTPKGKVFACRTLVAGAQLDAVLAPNVEDALKKLPIPKIMRWGSGEAEFIRPVHGLVMLHGSRIIPGEVWGAKSSDRTVGHRFLSKDPIAIKHADEYERVLREKGKVEADFNSRRKQIIEELNRVAGKTVELVAGDGLLDEITALVEWPAVYVAEFSGDFLAVPQECLVLSMQQHQKYVPLRDKETGKLLPRFLFVSNLETKQPRDIIHGNERVLNARLADARFFYDQDRKTRLEARVPRLASVIYHNKLGSQLERVERIQLLAGRIARRIGADPLLAERAAWLAKADLLTDMVGEFPELQGIMGRYYALHDGEPSAVADAIGDQYQLRFNDADPEHLVSASLYLADRVEQMVGLFGIGERPTGEGDPFALRRAALGVISVFEMLSGASALIGRPVPDIKELLEQAAGLFAGKRLAADTVAAVHEFIIDRYRNNLSPVFAKDAVEAVLSQRPPLTEVVPRVRAVEAFRRLPESESLAAANKRIRNILRKSEADTATLDESLLREPAERELHASLLNVAPRVAGSMKDRDYTNAMQVMATLKIPVDTFFDKVLVNAEDARLRNNRHALLRELDLLMNRVADISKLAV